MAKLRKYESQQDVRMTVKVAHEPSGVACTEPTCKGEMQFVLTNGKRTPGQIAVGGRTINNGLERAVCGECGWRGWV